MRPHRVQVFRDERGRWRWQRRAGNHVIVAQSLKTYASRWYCVRKAKRQVPRDVEFVIEFE